ncbi:MAG: ABC transporter ATP-binding protein [Synechococcales cyanobacterium C42_A2020_086]|nr:ABC transporter ATP-binding protein [Synechococcales cyanobacterium C42_A2020_086]
MARVRLDGISRCYHAVTAVAEITFEVPDGQFWVLVGPSGCGKSTILRIIAGLDRATSGTVWIGEQVVNHVPARQRDVAMVFQNYALYPHMTVAENLGFGLQMRGVDPQTRRKQVEAVADALNLSALLDRKPRQLSGGQQQRVALGRAIVRQPQVFLLDEPLSNLDAQLRDDTRAELKQLHQRLGVTTIYVTHDQVEAMTLADQIVVLDRGRIQQISDPQTLYNQPANQMVATFLGSPPMNILPATYKQGEFRVGQHSVPCPDRLRLLLQTLPNLDSVHLGIRPEHVHIVPAAEAAHLNAEAIVVEPLGRESLVRARWLGSAVTPVLTLHAAPQQLVRPGDRLFLQFDLDQLHVFDPASGKTLGYP